MWKQFKDMWYRSQDNKGYDRKKIAENMFMQHLSSILHESNTQGYDKIRHVFLLCDLVSSYFDAQSERQGNKLKWEKIHSESKVVEVSHC